ncbi:MAG: sulfite exporter TauE/SafE family protein [Oscillospiraceae bacterium]|nr:sulfite exporter TauE/SafE family protein [Oscillospiraceae bacterium]
MKKGKLYFYMLGAVTGFCNGLFGSGGGIAAVPMLQKGGVAVKSSHATSLALTLPLSVVSAFFYATESSFRWGDALPLIPFGLAGAVIGSLLIKKIPTLALKRIFGVILIISGGRMLL